MFENSNSSLDDLLDEEIKVDRPPKRINKHKASPKLEKRRKFPGPAGILPDNLGDESLLHENSFQEENDENEEDIEVANQVHFLSSTWKQMSQEFGEFINKFNINYIKTILLPNVKMPFLAAIIVHRDYFKGKIPIIRLTLKDLTGEINSQIHHDLYEEHINDFTVGNVIVLRDFSVLNMSFGRSHCITITQNNLLTIYSLKDSCFTQSSETYTQMPMGCERIDVQHFEQSNVNNFMTNATLQSDRANTKSNPIPSSGNNVSLDIVGPSMSTKSFPLLKRGNIFESNQIFDDCDIEIPRFQPVLDTNEKRKVISSAQNKIDDTKELPHKEKNNLLNDNNSKVDDVHKTNLKNKLKSFRFLANTNTNDPTCDKEKHKSDILPNNDSQMFEEAISDLDTDSFFADF